MAVQKTHFEKEAAKIWKLFRETREQMKETDRRMQETDRQIKAMSAETDRFIREGERQRKETDRRLKKLDELFTGQWGKLMEALVRGDLIKLLNKRNIKVDYILHSEERQGTYEERQWEVDIVAVNGEEVVVVEVKTTLKTKHVDHFLKKLKLFTKWRPRYEGSKIYGAVAYLKVNDGVDVYSEKKGLFVIKAVGSSSSITNAKNFKPKSWS